MATSNNSPGNNSPGKNSHPLPVRDCFWCGTVLTALPVCPSCAADLRHENPAHVSGKPSPGKKSLGKKSLGTP